MRLLANENFPGPVVRALRERGHDVMWVKEVMRGASDDEVLSRAKAEHRVLATLDRDFGELAFRFELPAECGIVYFRLRGTSPEIDNARIVTVLMNDTQWPGHFSVIEEDRVRIRPLPTRH